MSKSEYKMVSEKVLKDDMQNNILINFKNKQT